MDESGDIRHSRKYNQLTKHWDVAAQKCDKDYAYIPILLANIFKKRQKDLTVFMDVHGNLGLLGELETVSAVYGLEEGRLSHLLQDGMTRLSFTRDKLIFLCSKAS